MVKDCSAQLMPCITEFLHGIHCSSQGQRRTRLASGPLQLHGGRGEFLLRPACGGWGATLGLQVAAELAVCDRCKPLSDFAHVRGEFWHDREVTAFTLAHRRDGRPMLLLPSSTLSCMH